MKAILEVIDFLSNWSGKIFSFIVLIIMLIIGYEVVARYFFNAPTSWATESATLLFGIYAIMGGASTLCIRGHVSVDVFYALLSKRTRPLVDVIFSPVIFFYLGVLVWTAAIFGWESLTIKENTGTVAGLPVYPLKLSLPIAAFLVTLQGLANFIRDLYLFVTRKDMK